MEANNRLRYTHEVTTLEVSMIFLRLLCILLGVVGLLIVLLNILHGYNIDLIPPRVTPNFYFGAFVTVVGVNFGLLYENQKLRAQK
jgi:hypothetical protein